MIFPLYIFRIILFVGLTIFYSQCAKKSYEENQWIQLWLAYLMTNVNHTYIIPLYSYPIGTYENEWIKLYNLKTNKKVFVIINPNNGPGSNVDTNFVFAIHSLKNNNFKVIGYVYTSYGNRNISNIKLDIDNYLNFYGNPNIDGFFLDEVSNNTNTFSFYQNITDYIKSKNKLVILNPGSDIPSDFFYLANKIIVFENSYGFFINYGFPDYGMNLDKTCSIIYDTLPNQVSIVISKLNQHGIDCYYILDGDNNTGYFKLSPYLD